MQGVRVTHAGVSGLLKLACQGYSCWCVRVTNAGVSGLLLLLWGLKVTAAGIIRVTAVEITWSLLLL